MIADMGVAAAWPGDVSTGRQFRKMVNEEVRRSFSGAHGQLQGHGRGGFCCVVGTLEKAGFINTD